MSERKDEKWLDDQLRRAVDGTTPLFDAESWKHKYPTEYQAILRQNGQPGPFDAGRTMRLALRSSIIKYAVAAAIIVAISFFFARSERKPDGPVVKPQLLVQSPARMLSMMSLRMAYQQGGAEALDRQFQDTLNVFGPQSLSMSMQDLFEGVNGS